MCVNVCARGVFVHVCVHVRAYVCVCMCVEDVVMGVAYYLLGIVYTLQCMCVFIRLVDVPKHIPSVILHCSFVVCGRR